MHFLCWLENFNHFTTENNLSLNSVSFLFILIYFNLFSVKIQNFNVAFSLILPERVFMGGPFKLPVYFVL